MISYQTVNQEASDEFVERRSRFIGYVKPVQTEEDAVSFINQIRAKHWNATHNVYAYSLRQEQIRRYSDDGEPQGTAGIPVLDVLQKSDVTDTVVVVTRYFGGVMLGAGGLVRAYSHGAKIAVEAGGIITMGLCQKAQLTCKYHQYGKVCGLIAAGGGIVEDTLFTDTVCILFHIAEESLTVLNRQLADATCGEADVQITGQFFVKM